MSLTHEEMKAWLSEKLGREVTVSKVVIQGVQRYLVDYVNHYAPAKKLASESEEGAVANLFSYLQTESSPPPDSATKE